MVTLQPLTTPQQIKAVVPVAAEIWREHYTPLIGAAQVEYMLQNFQSEQAMAAQLQQGYRYFFLLCNGEIAGYTAVQPQADALFLSKLYVKAAYRGRGAARTAIEYMAAMAKELGLTQIYLTVNRGNAGSIAAYQKLGFVTRYDAVTDIGGGFVMDDHIMYKQL